VKKKEKGNKVVIERRLNKGVEKGRREGQEEGRMKAGEWVGVGERRA
jgi:flagellar biosynthesis/type III secretory pathway protein FliH